jgi:transglutaminase-like putative cysteine protease
MNYEIVHTTEYHYEDSISLCHNTARLTPRSTAAQLCKKTNMRILPQPDVMNEYTDFFGNKVVYFAIQQEHKQLLVSVTSLVAIDQSGQKNGYESKMGWEEAKEVLDEKKPEYLDAKAFI